jgi:hypothetical protein
MAVRGVQSAQLALRAEEEMLVAAEIESVRMEVSEQAPQAERRPGPTRSGLREHDDEPAGSLDPLQRVRRPSLVLDVGNLALEPHDRRRGHTSRNPHCQVEPKP